MNDSCSATRRGAPEGALGPTKTAFWGALLFLLTTSWLGTGRAQVPQLLNFQGRVQVGTTDFQGTGQFKFALVNADGTSTYWSNDGTAAGEPAAAVSLPVTKGLYSILLGNALVPNMTILPATVFTNSEVHLRVWFNDGVNGFQQFAPDQRIAAVGYAMMAATVPDGSITAAKIAPGAVSQLGTPDGSTAVQVGATGNVGVGVLNPAAKLDVSGNIRAGTLSLEGGSPGVSFKSQNAPNTTGYIESGPGAQSYSAAHGGGPHLFTTPRFQFGYQTEPGQNRTPVFGFSDSGYIGSLKPDGGYRNLLDNGSGGMILQSDADIAGDLLLKGSAYINGNSIVGSNAVFRTNVNVQGNLEIQGDLQVRGIVRQNATTGAAFEVPQDPWLYLRDSYSEIPSGGYEHIGQRGIDLPANGVLVVMASVNAWVFTRNINGTGTTAWLEVFDETGNRTLAVAEFSNDRPAVQHVQAAFPVTAGRRVISTKIKGAYYHDSDATSYELSTSSLILMYFPKDMGFGP